MNSKINAQRHNDCAIAMDDYTVNCSGSESYDIVNELIKLGWRYSEPYSVSDRRGSHILKKTVNGINNKITVSHPLTNNPESLQLEAMVEASNG